MYQSTHSFHVTNKLKRMFNLLEDTLSTVLIFAPRTKLFNLIIITGQYQFRKLGS